MDVKTCKGCNREYQPRDKRQAYCSRKCQRATTAGQQKKRDYERHYTSDLRFIGVDGEGVTRPDGSHEYVMLSVGSKTLWKDGGELRWSDIFPWLYERFTEDPDAAYVGFFLSYDFLEWTKGLEEEQARLLWTPKGIASRKPKRKGFIQSFPVVVEREWEIDVLANKRFRLRPHTHSRLKNDPMKCYCGEELELESVELVIDEGEEFSWDSLETLKVTSTVGKKWMYICDTGPYWQCSFLAAINPKKWPKPIVSEGEYETLKEGKSKRGEIWERGEIGFFEEMRRYNVMENEILGRLTEELNKGFLGVGVKIAKEKWFGPGQAASVWMKGLCGKSERPFTRGKLFEGSERRVPQWVEEFARKTYYGGWFEQFMHGHIAGTLWEYDINSAYPCIIAKLPCLHDSEQWGRGEGNREWIKEELYMLRVRVRGSDPYIGCMPFRDRKGRILRVHECEGWYWKHELDAGVRVGIIDTYEVVEWVSFTPCECKSPLGDIEGLYQQRLVVGKNSPEGKALKLLYNSVYGKFAQSIGNPLFGNPIYASLITAGCRTMILDAIATHPEQTRAVSMVATDGVYFRSPHPRLDISATKLGAWDVTEKHNVTQFMPGLYWDDRIRDVLDKEEKSQETQPTGELPLKTRGVNVRDLTDRIRELDRRFRESHNDYKDGKAYEWPMLGVPVRFDIVSPGQALARGKWETVGMIHGELHTLQCGEECKKGKKTICSTPVSKRMIGGSYPIDDEGIIRSGVYTGVDGQYETLPYDKTFGYEEEMSEIITREGGKFLEWFFRDGGNGE